MSSETRRRTDRRTRNQRFQSSERADTLGTNVYSSKDNQSLHKALNGEFILYQILLQEILDENKPLPNQDSGIYEYFQPDNPTDQKVMNEFDKEYKAEKAIHWYTRESCVYKILNKALRTQNIDDVSAFSKFVRDLHQQLREEQKIFAKAQKCSILTVYRGQFISLDEITRLKSTIGELLSINSFLSTSTNKQKALEFATSRPPPNDQLVSVLLEIYVNIKSPSRPVADIRHYSAFAEEEEILFMFGAVFRIDDIWFDEENKLWRARFTLCSNGDTDMIQFLSSLNLELEGQNKFISIGNYFIQMQKYEEAEDHFLNLLDENLLKDPIELAFCYHGLSQVNDKKGNYKSAIVNLKTALDYLLKASPNNDHPLISQCYNDLGSVYTTEADYPLAMQFYEKALKTTNNIPSISYQGLSRIHFKLENYILSKEYLEKALENQPATADAAIANNYIAMAKIYAVINQNDKAAEMFDKAIESQTKLLGENHPDIGDTYNALGIMYLDINDQEKAFEYFQKAYELQSQTLPQSHSDFAGTFTNYGDFYVKKEEFDPALVYYHKALENQLKTLAWSHPAVAQTYLTIGLVHLKKNDYENALIYFQKVLDSELVRKKPGDISLSNALKRVADVYFSRNDIDNSLIFYLKYIDNELEVKLYEDISLIDTYKKLGDIYYKKRLLSESLVYYNRLLDCYLKKQPLNENDIKQVYKFIGKAYLKKHDFSETLLFYEKSQNKLLTKDQSNAKLSDEKPANNEINQAKLPKRKYSKNEYRNIDNIHFEKRHLDQALNYFEKYLNEQLKDNSENQSSIGNTYQILGNICLEKKYFDQALDYFIKLLNSKLKKKKLDDSKLSNIYNAIGTIYLEKNLLNQSLIYFNRLIDCRFKKKRSFQEPSVIQAYQRVGQVYLAKHDFDQTSNYINRLIQNPSSIKQKKQPDLTDFQFEKRHLEAALFYFHQSLDKQIRNPSLKLYSLQDLFTIIANLFLEKQDFYQSLSYLQRLLNYQLKQNPLGDLSSANTYAVMANIYLKQDLSDQALQYYRQALQISQKLNPIDQTFIKKLKYRIREILVPNV